MGTAFSDRPRSLVLGGGYLVAYLLLAGLTYARPVLAPGITPWNPQTGLTIAFLILCGPRWCVLTVFAVCIDEWVVKKSGASTITVVAGALWIGAAYGTLAVIARRILPLSSIRTTAEAATFAGAAGVVTLAAAAGYVGCFVVSTDVAPADTLRGIARYWFADLNGTLMLTPLLLIGKLRGAGARALRSRHLETFAQFALVLALPWAIFALPVTEQLRFFYLLFVPVIWIALRWNWAGALPAVLVIQAVLILAADADIHTPRFVDLQIFMLTLSLTALLLGSVVAERRRSGQQIREREAALSRAMRFAVAGELAASLAHELNQPIAALVSYLNAADILATSPEPEDARLRTTLRKATQEAIRAADVMQKLRNFYAGGRSRRDIVDVGVLCNTVATAFADRLRRTGTQLDVYLDGAHREVATDETQMEIVLHNLLANAIDATSAGADSPRHIEMRIGRRADTVTIAVDDNGPGIPAQVMEQLFEPFTTSKPDGMGLGLALSRSLVRAYGGELAYSASGRLGGASFLVTLPAITNPASET